MSQSYSMTQRAYAKIILHCYKYPHLAVNGVVIGSISKETQSVQIQDTIPLFHSGIGLAPMLEVALTQAIDHRLSQRSDLVKGLVEIYASKKGLNIVGYYHANELLTDAVLSDTAQAIGTKITQHCDKACLMMIENAKLTDSRKHALKVYVKKDQSSNWKEQTGSFKLQDKAALGNTLKLIENRMFEQLVDFDNHLDSPRLDWTNQDINAASRSSSPV